MRISVIICAAGKGERARFDKNKLLIPMGGAPVLYHTVWFADNFLSCLGRSGEIDADGEYVPDEHSGDERAELIITSSPQDMPEITAICAPFGGIVVEGGETRTESVYNALKHVTGDIVLIHDGARPFTGVGKFLTCLDCVKKYKSGIIAAPATDTVYIADGNWAAHIPERSTVFNVQTPQGFFTGEIKAAYEKAMQSGETFTDDGSVYTRFVGPARICPYGSAADRKLTYRQDFDRLNDFSFYPVCKDGCKVGIGIDVHAFGKEQDFIMMCGVKVPCDCGLIAHSDGDVALHAVTDAILSAAGMRDIGYYFPDNDPALKEADSSEFLKKVVNLIYESERGYKVGSLSVAIQAEKPRLAPYIDKMKERLSALTGADKENIGISAGTSEGLGFVGEKRGICVTCAAVLKRYNYGEN